MLVLSKVNTLSLSRCVEGLHQDTQLEAMRIANEHACASGHMTGCVKDYHCLDAKFESCLGIGSRLNTTIWEEALGLSSASERHATHNCAPPLASLIPALLFFRSRAHLIKLQSRQRSLVNSLRTCNIF